MAKSRIEDEIARLSTDPSLSRQDTVDALKKMLFDARAAQRTATESAMIDDDGLNNDLRALEIALEEFGIDPHTIDGSDSAATL